jgi:aryl-alcohol dehydrogenase-like predicted oxidoreductase
MERRRLGASGPEIAVIGVCPAGPEREALAERAREAGCTIVDGRLPEGAAAVRYPLMDQLGANTAIPRLRREGKGVVAVHVFGGGALFSPSPLLRGLVKPGRTLAQAAIQFVLANESVSAACVRVSSRAHLEEALSAPDAPPLSGSDLELIFEAWAHRND